MLQKNYDKTRLRSHVMDMLSGKIKTLDFYLQFTLEASRDIKKSPKYDSFREEMQEEIYHLDKQMHTLTTMKKQMSKVLNAASDRAHLGALVITNKARFYISVGLGEFFFEGDRYYAISPESPLAKLMAGKAVGDDFILNKIHQQIEQIF